jgi:hypothetical protein
MKIEIYCHNYNGYYIATDQYCYDAFIAEVLDLTLEKYQGILKYYGAFTVEGEYYFKNKYDAESAFQHLEHLIIMAQLIQ